MEKKASKKGLEEAIKEKVGPLLEEIMEKSWGITIPKLESDITDQLKNPQFDIYIPLGLTFSKAKKAFKSEFLKKELKLHKCNISHLAKMLGLDRRSVHRVIKELDIDLEKIRTQEELHQDHHEELVDQTIRLTLAQYKEIIQPQKMEKIYQEVPSLSRNIAKFIPHQELSWKEAEREFEKQFLEHALKECKSNVTKTAEKIGIRTETLHRKIKKLGLRK